MFKYSVLFLLLVAFGAADEQSTSDSSSADLNELLAEFRVVLEAVRNECPKNAGAVSNIVSASEHLNTNVKPDLQKKFTDSISNSSKKKPDDVVGDICEGLDQVKNIYVNITGYLIPCLENNDMKTLNATYKMLDGVIKYTCVSNRNEVLRFLNDGGADCMIDNKKELGACGTSAFESLLDESSEKSEGGKSDEEGGRNDRDFGITKEHCNRIENYKSCVNKILKKCSFTAAASTVAAYIDIVVREMPCNQAEQELDNNI